MTKNRREFIRLSALGGAALLTTSACSSEIEESLDQENPEEAPSTENNWPIVVSTWTHGREANAAAWEILSKGGSALDAVETGVRVTESDPENSSVGIGGLPDRDGNVTLDACIMDHQNQCGAVACLENIENPISVARKVMEETDHVMIVGKGALEFALDQGFEEKDLLTDKAREAWEKWKVKSEYKPEVNIENHDTIGLLAIDQDGNISGACTTSGMAYKLHGRVGDSPIIGAGLFVDNEVGAATATGVGEAVIRIAGSAAIVEAMRHGKTPQEACEEAVNRILATHPDRENLQVGFLAINKKGEVGAHCIKEGFNVAKIESAGDDLSNATFALDN